MSWWASLTACSFCFTTLFRNCYCGKLLATHKYLLDVSSLTILWVDSTSNHEMSLVQDPSSVEIGRSIVSQGSSIRVGPIGSDRMSDLNRSGPCPRALGPNE